MEKDNVKSETQNTVIRKTEEQNIHHKALSCADNVNRHQNIRIAGIIV
jgi:hypothetical protein